MTTAGRTKPPRVMKETSAPITREEPTVYRRFANEYPSFVPLLSTTVALFIAWLILKKFFNRRSRTDTIEEEEEEEVVPDEDTNDSKMRCSKLILSVRDDFASGAFNHRIIRNLRKYERPEKADEVEEANDSPNTSQSEADEEEEEKEGEEQTKKKKKQVHFPGGCPFYAPGDEDIEKINEALRAEGWAVHSLIGFADLTAMSKKCVDYKDAAKKAKEGDEDQNVFGMRLHGKLATAQLRARTRAYEKTLTEDQKKSEAEIRAQQLESIFKMMMENQEKFGVNNKEDLAEQMKLYSV